MNEFKQLHPRPDVTLLAVKVPEGAISAVPLPPLNTICFEFSTGKKDNIYINLPINGPWKLLGKATEIHELKWREIVSKVIVDTDIWFGYVKDLKLQTFGSAKEAGMSFLEANEVDPNSVLLKLINQ